MQLVNEDGKRIHTSPRFTTGRLEARQEAEQDEKRRTVIIFYDFPLALGGYNMVSRVVRTHTRPYR